jgi:hypothetical protein
MQPGITLMRSNTRAGRNLGLPSGGHAKVPVAAHFARTQQTLLKAIGVGDAVAETAGECSAQQLR